MFLIVGLGNPGDSYKFNRHNAGFLFLDTLKEIYHLPDFKKGKGQTQISEGEISGHKVMLLKPQTFMNLSGGSVMSTMAFYKIKPENVLVIHDELELEPGNVRLKKGGGHGGHNGLRSMDGSIGKEYWRLRIGIGRPPIKDMVSSYVLHNFPLDDFEKIFIPLFETLADHFPKIWTEDEQLGSDKYINDVKL